MRATFLAVAALLVAAPAAASPSDLNNAEVLLKLYPKRALAAGEQGVVGFKVELDKAGHPKSCEVTQSSGFPLLDAETCTVITQNAVFAPNPGVGSASSFHAGTIAWKLPAGITPATPAKFAQAPEKKICKRTPRTGSHAAFDRVCMTRKQWDEQTTESKANFEEQQTRGWKAGTN